MHSLDRALDLWWFFFGPVIGNLIRESIAGQEHQVSPMLREYLACANSEGPITLERFMKACADRDLLRAELLRQMHDTPVLLSPVSSSPAFRHGEGNYFPGTGYRDTMRFSQWLNLTGFPAASVPVGLSNEGLPIGVQVIGRPLADTLVSAAADKFRPILHRRPAFSGCWLAPPGRISPPPHPFASVSIAPQVDRTCQQAQAPARYPAETRPQPVHPSHFAYKQLLDSYVRMGDWGLAPRPAPALKSLLELHPDSGRPCLRLSEIQPSRRQPRSCA